MAPGSVLGQVQPGRGGKALQVPFWACLVLEPAYSDEWHSV